MGGDTKMELGFPATPLSAVPGICPERGVQPARQPSFAFGEGGFGTLNIAAFGRRCAIKRHDANGAKAATRRTNASIQVVQAHAWYTNEDCPGLWTNSTPEKPQSELPYDIKRCEALSAISGPASTHVASRRGIFGRSQA